MRYLLRENRETTNPTTDNDDTDFFMIYQKHKSQCRFHQKTLTHLNQEGKVLLRVIVTI